LTDNAGIMYSGGMGAAYILVPLLLFFLFRRKFNIEAITYNDGMFYEQDIDPEFYFVERVNQQNVTSNTDKASENRKIVDPQIKKESDSSRVLKGGDIGTERKGEDNVLVLRDNEVVDGVQDRDHAPPMPKSDSVIVRNNFIEQEEIKGKSPTLDNEATESNRDFKHKGVTYHDYRKLHPGELFNYDKRSFCKYFTDELILYHSMVKVILKRSLIEPPYICSLKATLKTNLIFFLNAITLTDDLIQLRAMSDDRVRFY
jgi:hypothetical protein